MDEWSEYIKKVEVDKGTELGKNLSFEVRQSIPSGSVTLIVGATAAIESVGG